MADDSAGHSVVPMGVLMADYLVGMWAAPKVVQMADSKFELKAAQMVG